MTANTTPIYSQTPHVSWVAAITAANNTYTGTGSITTLFTAAATYGSFVRSIKAKAAGSCTASCLRIFIGNGSSNTTATNNSLYAEFSLPTTTAIATAATSPEIEIPLNLALPGGYTLFAVLGTAVSAGWGLVTVGGDYAANSINPLYTLTPVVGNSAAILTANNTYTGTGTIGTVFTAGANGGYLRSIKAKALGTNIASVVRVFLNNGGANSSATNNGLYAEFSLPITTSSALALLPEIEIPINVALPGSYTAFCVIGTTVAAGWNFTGVGGSY